MHTHSPTQGAGEPSLRAEFKPSRASLRTRKVSVRDEGVSGDSLQPAAGAGERERPPQRAAEEVCRDGPGTEERELCQDYRGGSTNGSQ